MPNFESGHRFQHVLENRHREIDRVTNQAAQLHSYTGRFVISGLGVLDVSTTVNFPITFAQKPTFTYGIELEENWSVAPGTVPTCTAMVLKWQRYERLAGIFSYTGATLGVTLLGSPGLVWVVYKMMGPAYRNPIKGSSGTGSTI